MEKNSIFDLYEHIALGGMTQRAHGEMTQSAWTKLSSTITTSDGVVLQRIKVKEKDYAPEQLRLMTAKTYDELLMYAEIRAQELARE